MIENVSLKEHLKQFLLLVNLKLKKDSSVLLPNERNFRRFYWISEHGVQPI